MLPQIGAFNFEEEYNLNDAVSAVCSITKGDQPLKIFWSFTDAETSVERNLTTNDGVIITRNGNKLSVLNIESIKSRHRGIYKCISANKAGVAEYSATLAINGDS